MVKKGKNKNQFDYVFGLCIIDPYLYVSDNGNQRILLFHSK